MSLKDVTDWSSFLDKSSPIPTDVVIDVRETVKMDDGTLEVRKCFEKLLIFLSLLIRCEVNIVKY